MNLIQKTIMAPLIGPALLAAGQELSIAGIDIGGPNSLSIRVEGDQPNRYNVTQLEARSAIGLPWYLVSTGMANSRGSLSFDLAMENESPTAIYRAKRLTDVVRPPESRWDQFEGFEQERQFAFVGPDNMRVAYFDAGEGDPVVFLHGVYVWSYVWRDYFEALVNAGRRVIAIDLPGFGFSDRPVDSESFSIDRTSAWIREMVVDELDLENAVLVGHSFNADAAIHVAMGATDRVSGLVVIGGSLFDGSDPQVQGGFVGVVGNLRHSPSLAPSDVLNFFGLTEGPLSQSEASAFNAPYLNGIEFRSGWIGASQMKLMEPDDQQAASQRDAWSDLQESDLPLLVISSDFWAEGDWPERFRTVPGAQGQPHRHFEGDVGNPEIDFADEVRGLIVDWVSSID